jgi:adenine-specific DNA-methyltransferase
MTPFDKAFEDVQVLVNTFNSNYSHYMHPTYSEAEARQDFIDNFFIALGWDVRHQYQTDPYNQEVKIEKSQKQQNESARKRADYAFYVLPNTDEVKFFAEAKKPSVLIQNNPQHYFQTIKYGWNSGCPICVLTDFEELAIIDCRQKPNIKYALNGKHKTYSYKDYVDKEKFAEIYWLFSREAVGNNSLQKYASNLPKPKGKIVQKALFKGGYKPVDEDFLEELDSIRENIAKAFKKANENLNSEQLTEATQRTVDRLVFIRFLEDKFIEAAEHVSEWKSWNDFISDCRKLDAKYNGVVFKKHFIDEPHFLGADEKLFLDICSDISNLNSPYDFNYIPIHILGSIYERFLGKVVRATDKKVFIEEKPEVRKAGGVYYTPKYIVDYIVQHTVGKIIDGLTPAQIAEKHFADIACGSGSFLIGVYDCLLDYHKKYYAEKLSGKTEIDKRSEDYGNVEYKDGQWRLTLKLKQNILLNNIYGVDIDAQAVEVTQLSLFLKMLDEENVSSTTTKQGALFSKVLPDLSKNIVCGNSLIGFDIMNGQLFEDDELKKLNPMDYETAFPKIMRNGGFDAVVGNPPYGANFDDHSKKYLFEKYPSIKGQPESYEYFIDKSIDTIKKDAKIGIIVPTTFTESERAEGLRKLILTAGNIDVISNFRYAVWKDNASETLVFIYSKVTSSKTKIILPLSEDEFSSENNSIEISQNEWLENNKYRFLLRADSKLIRKIEEGKHRLDEICDSSQGIIVYKTREDSAKNLYISDTKNEGWVKLLDTHSSLNRYGIEWGGYYLNYGKWLWCSRDNKYFEKDKIVFIRLRNKSLKRKLIGYFDNEKFYNRDNFNNIINRENSPYDLKFILAIFNSELINYWYKSNFDNVNINPAQIKLIPIPKIDFTNPTQKQQHDKLVDLVTQMLSSKKQLAAAITDSDKNFLQNKCSSIDRQIDNLVYGLYGLSEEEVRIVEGN